jgi:AraC-like DNA-binding protein
MPSGYFAIILRSNAATSRTGASLLQGTGITESALSANCSITLGQQLRQIRNAARCLDPQWSLRAGAHMSAAAHGPNGIAIVNAPTLRDSLVTLTRFAHLRAPHLRFRSVSTADSELRLVADDGVWLAEEERRPLLDMVMLSTQAVIEDQLGRPMHEARFEFPYTAPEHARAYEDFFHGKVLFNRAEAAVVIPERMLNVESPFADPAMHRASIERLYGGAHSVSGDRRLVARIEQLLAQRGARLGLGRAARLLSISERTLARRLAGQGTSFQALTDNTLKSRAAVLLRDQELKVAEVAYSLGYEDAANFSRAFRRWFGMTPRQYRATMDLEGFSHDP